jgi:hypothetical protein
MLQGIFSPLKIFWGNFGALNHFKILPPIIATGGFFGDDKYVA